VEEAWSRFWTWHLGDIAGYVIMIALLVEVAIFLRHDGSAPATLVIFVSLLVAKSVFDEVRQLLQGMVFTDWDSSPSSKSAHVKLRCGHRILQYFVEIGNWIDWTCIIMAVSGTHAIATFQGNMYDRGRVGLFCASQWLRLMYSFRALNWCGPRLMPILYAVKDTGAFLAIVLCCIMSALHAYYILAARDGRSPIYEAFLQIARLGLLGDFDLHDFEGVDTVFMPGGERRGERDPVWEPEDPEPSDRYILSHLIFFFVGAVVTVILMNILIGILSANYDLYEDIGRELFLRERANLIRNYWGRIRAWERLCPWFMRRKAKVAADAEFATYLWFAVREEGHEASSRSVRSDTGLKLRALEEHQQMQFQELKKKQEAHFKAQQEQFEVLTKQLRDLHDRLEDSKEFGPKS